MSHAHLKNIILRYEKLNDHSSMLNGEAHTYPIK